MPLWQPTCSPAFLVLGRQHPVISGLHGARRSANRRRGSRHPRGQCLGQPQAEEAAGARGPITQKTLAAGDGNSLRSSTRAWPNSGQVRPEDEEEEVEEVLQGDHLHGGAVVSQTQAGAKALERRQRIKKHFSTRMGGTIRHSGWKPGPFLPLSRALGLTGLQETAVHERGSRHGKGVWTKTISLSVARRMPTAGRTHNAALGHLPRTPHNPGRAFLNTTRPD